MLLQALQKKLEGDLAVAKANIMVYKEKSLNEREMLHDGTDSAFSPSFLNNKKSLQRIRFEF